MGTAHVPGIEHSEGAGIIPRAVQDIFEGVTNQTDNEYLVKISFIEVRNVTILFILHLFSSFQLETIYLDGMTREGNARMLGRDLSLVNSDDREWKISYCLYSVTCLYNLFTLTKYNFMKC